MGRQRGLLKFVQTMLHPLISCLHFIVIIIIIFTSIIIWEEAWPSG